MKLTPRTEIVNIRMSPALKRAAQKAAETESRSLSSLIVVLLVAHLRAAKPQRGKK